MSRFTYRQWSDIRRSIGGGDNTIPGSWIIDGSVTKAKIDPAVTAHWDRAYDLRVESWAMPLSWASNIVSLLPQGADGDIDVVEVPDGGGPRTVTLCIRNGLITNFAGKFDCIDPATTVTITLQSVNGLVVPSSSFLGHDAYTNATRLVTVLSGRVITV